MEEGRGDLGLSYKMPDHIRELWCTSKYPQRAIPDFSAGIFRFPRMVFMFAPATRDSSGRPFSGEHARQ
jgi:hypothetical protein